MPLIFCFPRCFAYVIVVLCLLVFRVRWFIHRHKKGKNMLGQFPTLLVQLMLFLLLISLLNTFWTGVIKFLLTLFQTTFYLKISYSSG